MEQALLIDSFQNLFSRPLILGASVSADYLSLSPGKRLALRFTDSQEIHTIAHNGRPGRETMKLVHERDLRDRSVVIALDLFFWDATLNHPQTSLQALHHLVEMVNKRQVPLILGDIPELLPGWQVSRKILQDEIHRLCHVNRFCTLMPLEHLYKEVLRDGGITYKGTQYNLWDLVPDGLHIGDIAGNYLADKMLSLFDSSSAKLAEAQSI